MPLFVFIAGASGSGKTFIANKLSETLQNQNINCRFLAMDDYYKARPSHIKTEAQLLDYKRCTNFDTPEALDFNLLLKHIQQLNQQQIIYKPLYDMNTGLRQDNAEAFPPAEVIIIEGIFALHNFDRLKLNNAITVFVETNCYSSYKNQRTPRDIQERGRSKSEVHTHEVRYVRNGFFSFIAPTKCHAMTVITNQHPTPENNRHVSSLESQLDGLIQSINKKLAGNTNQRLEYS